jgi:predicted RNA-binding protein YlqC (UPF0109 family)
METERPKANVSARHQAIKDDIRSTLEFIVKKIVDNPAQASITETQGEQTVVFEVRVGRGEIGKVVGKKGAMAESLRQILKSLSAKNRIRAVLEIVD